MFRVNKLSFLEYLRKNYLFIKYLMIIKVYGFIDLVLLILGKLS